MELFFLINILVFFFFYYNVVRCGFVNSALDLRVLHATFSYDPSPIISPNDGCRLPIRHHLLPFVTSECNTAPFGGLVILAKSCVKFQFAALLLINCRLMTLIIT